MADDRAFTSAAYVAENFVKARRSATALPAFPGAAPPPELESAYACQEAAIGLWDDEIAGWKIGRIPPEYEVAYGQSRLAGPIFTRGVWPFAGAPVDFPVFVGGFAAVEAEYVLVVGRNAPADKRNWTLAEAREMVQFVRIGVETAGSPLATINALGPTVVVSDFGNNAGLILGPEVEGVDEALVFETFIEGVSQGRGKAADIPGGPFESLRFLLENTARRGRPLKAGQLVSTGAVTGIHDIRPGQTARVSFGRLGEITCRAMPAGPRA
jgi:2-keto-4-pentenoate hydratase